MFLLRFFGCASTEIGFDHFFIGFYLFSGSFNQLPAFSHHNHWVAETTDKIHVVFDHTEGVSFFTVHDLDRISDFLEQGSVYPGSNLIDVAIASKNDEIAEWLLGWTEEGEGEEHGAEAEEENEDM